MQLEVLSVHSKEANVLLAVRACKKYKKTTTILPHPVCRPPHHSLKAFARTQCDLHLQQQLEGYILPIVERVKGLRKGEV